MNKNVAQDVIAESDLSLMFLPHFDVFWQHGICLLSSTNDHPPFHK